MTLQAIPGVGIYSNSFPGELQMAPSFGSVLIDATGEKVALIGRVWNKDHATKDIHTVGFRFGTVTKAGGSALTVSLQDVSLTTAPPEPDEVQDQTVAIANADASFVSNTWYQTGALSADRTVAFGELIAIVIEYDGAGRLSSDAVNISSWVLDSVLGTPNVSLKTASWDSSTAKHCPNVILGFSDGSFGTFDGAFPTSATSSIAFKQDTAGSDEYANEFSFPFPCKVDGCSFIATIAANTSDFNLILYSGTTALVTVAVDASTVNLFSRWYYFPFAEQTLAANTIYRLAIQPSQTTSNVSVYYHDVSTANHFQAHDLGISNCMTSRVNLGSWAATTTTRRLFMSLRISALDDGTYPAAGDVQTGVSFNGTTGTFDSPAVGDVDSTAAGYGAGGTEFTPTLVVPAITDVKSGVSYGAGGSEFTGTLAGGGGGGGPISPIGKT